MPTEMKLPELGENIEGGDVLRVMINPGDTIAKEQPVLELETDKATIEVPSSLSGVVKEARIKQGDKIKVGQTIFVVDEAASTAGTPTEGKGQRAEGTPTEGKGQRAEGTGQRAEGAGQRAEGTPTEGIGQRAEGTGRRAEGQGQRAEGPGQRAEGPGQRAEGRAEGEDGKSGSAAQTAKAAPQAEPRRPAQVVEMTRPRPPAPDAAAIPAAPAARRLARELGVNIQDIQGSGTAGRISMDDVTAYARRLLQGGAVGKAAAAAPLPDLSAWGPVERKAMSGVRRTTAHRLTQAWNTVPHVFQQDRADATAVDALRKRLSNRAEADGRSPVTLTAFLIQILAAALKKFPQMNSAVDLAADEIVYKQYIHIGVAVDTDRGLLVPVIRDVDRKDLFTIADDVARAAEKARARKLSLDEMQGGSMTISNLGSLGAGPFTPIVNWPEVAILGVARARMEPVFIDGQFQPRLMMPLTLSYDHRVIDGADAARIIRWIVEAVEQPALMWIEEPR